MKTPGGLTRKQVYLSAEEVAQLAAEVRRRRKLGEEATESSVLRALVRNLAVNSPLASPRNPTVAYSSTGAGALRS